VSAFRLRRLGRTDVELPELGLGGAPFGDLFTALDDAVVDATLQAAWGAGIRFFDSAPHYGAGLSEHRLGRFLRHVPRDEFLLSTKVGRVLRPAPGRRDLERGPFVGGLPFEQVFDYGYDAVQRSHEDSLQRLGLARVDLLLIHDLDVRHHPDPDVRRRHLDDLAAGGMRALEELKAGGAIRAIGAGVNEPEMIPTLLERVALDFVLLAMPYTLLDQRALDDGLPLCAEHGVGVVVGAVFNSGILAAERAEDAPYNYAAAPREVIDRVEALRAACDRHGAPLPAAALRFPLCHPSVASVIPGALEPAHVEANAAHVRREIPPALWADLIAEGLLREDAPVPAGHPR
jgi:D-threo-aldose 1-dehydrogenase